MKGETRVLIGLFLRNYKSYDKTSFIPIVKNNKAFSFFIGENGVGKSSVLESLDLYFNRTREWNINKNNKNKDELFIAPIHLIKKESLNLSEAESEYVKKISDALLNWNIDETNHMKSSEWVKDFYSFLNELKNMNNLKDYYMILTPLHYDENVVKKFFIFESLITNLLGDYDIKVLNCLFESVRTSYAYIYIPVETPVDEILRMETTEMQLLVSEDILQYTEKLLTDKNIQEGKKKLNIVDKINNKLDEFMVNVNYTISTIDNSYNYSAEGKAKKYLTAKDIREHIFKAYFSIRSLNKNKKNIIQLSSGEKRKALIDIATAFLKQESSRSKEMILAIDEPETSMHMKKIFNQFKQLESLSFSNDVQFIGTTHWYGFLPITDYGNLTHISKDNENLKITSFDFYNLFERNEKFPDDIEMKSFFELVTSILTSIKSSSYDKWIICEGSDDKRYLEYYLKYKHKNNNLIILPVSGCGNVKKLYSLLYASLIEKDKVKLLGKILCLVDTDLGSMGLPNNFQSDFNDTIYIRRLQLHDNQIKLDKIAPNSQRHSQTEVEDSLEPKKYFNALKEAVKNTRFENILNSYKINLECKVSKVKNDNANTLFIFDIENGNIEHVNELHRLISFLETKEIKQKICTYYTAFDDSENIPTWISDIIDLLELDSVEIRKENTSKNDSKSNSDKTLEERISIELESEQIKILDTQNNNLNISSELLELLKKIDNLNAFESIKLNNLINENSENKDLVKYISSNFVSLSKNHIILNSIINFEMKINFSIWNFFKELDLFIESNTVYKVIQIIFINKENFTSKDLEILSESLNDEDLFKNDALHNEAIFLVYASLKLNSYNLSKEILTKQELIILINSIYTIIYFGHFNNYIQIGYKFKNIVALSNSILNTKSLSEYIDIYIHALKQYNVFDKLIKEDKQKTFIKKLTRYYKHKPRQSSEYNNIFNIIFNDFNLD